jgi:hypothetical protein
MTTHPERTYPPLLAQGQTWEEMTAGRAFRTAAGTITETDLITFITWGGFSARDWSCRSTCSTGRAWRSCPWT